MRRLMVGCAGLASMALWSVPSEANHHRGMKSAILEQCNYPGYVKRHPDQCPAQAMMLKKPGGDASGRSS